MKKLLLALTFTLLPLLPAVAQTNYSPSGEPIPSYMSNQQQQRLNDYYSDTYTPFDFSSQEEEEEKPRVINQYSNEYKKNLSATHKGGRENIIPGMNSYVMDFERLDGAAPGDFTLRISAPIAVTGCANINQSVIAVRETPPVMTLDANAAELKLDKSVRYAHYQCDIRTKTASIALPLNRNELIEKGINHITFKNANGGARDIQLEVTDSKVTAMVSGPRTKNAPMGTPGAGGVATYWFYPDNTVIITAPGRNLDANAREKVSMFAQQMGLQPLGAIFADYTDTETDKFYFVDASGALKSRIASEGRPVNVGNIEGSETFQGPAGAYEKPAAIQLFAKLPGVNE